jgi:hypothetical protein
MEFGQESIKTPLIDSKSQFQMGFCWVLPFDQNKLKSIHDHDQFKLVDYNDLRTIPNPKSISKTISNTQDKRSTLNQQKGFRREKTNKKLNSIRFDTREKARLLHVVTVTLPQNLMCTVAEVQSTCGSLG